MSILITFCYKHDNLELFAEYVIYCLIIDSEKINVLCGDINQKFSGILNSNNYEDCEYATIYSFTGNPILETDIFEPLGNTDNILLINIEDLSIKYDSYFGLIPIESELGNLLSEISDNKYTGGVYKLPINIGFPTSDGKQCIVQKSNIIYVGISYPLFIYSSVHYIFSETCDNITVKYSSVFLLHKNLSDVDPKYLSLIRSIVNGKYSGIVNYVINGLTTLDPCFGFIDKFDYSQLLE